MVQARDFVGNQRFEVLTRLGRGGMGTVYQVIDHARRARLALKSVGQLSGDALLRLQREFAALSEIDHPNIIELGELLEQDGHWFFTMELVDGSEFLEYVRPSAESGEQALEPQKPARHQPDSRLDHHPVTRGSGFDEARLRRSLGQLAEGLYALHGCGHVHRDVKPSNVLVTREGRVVLIDFGLVTDARAGSTTAEQQIVGTAAYMSPEQAAGQPVGPESDWYAFGVMLYEALTGRLPIDGSGLAQLTRKQTEVPGRPRQLVPHIPDDLDALCMELLRIDPAQRPRGRVILERLHVDSSHVKPVSTTVSVAERPDQLVGREQELAFLDGELAHVLSGAQRIVTVVGESGLGKSALLRHFAHRLESEEREVLVLSGRCHEHDSLPYNALDAVMEQICRWLKRLPAERCAALLPENVALLEHAFPVLSRVPAIARNRPERTEVRDAQQRRLLVMRALRALFDRIARHVPLVVLIDDFQWSDQDSSRMLAQLTGPPAPPPLLLVCAARDQSEQAMPDARPLKLRPLSPEHSVELASRIARHLGPAGAEHARNVALQANGSPFLIETLLHQLGDASETVRREELDERMARFVGALDEPARRLLEVVYLAGFPVTQQIAADAAGLEPAELVQSIRALRISRLVRTSGALNTDVVEPYHDSICTALVRSLSALQREPIHDALARALETQHREPQRIAYHLRAGSEPRRATSFLILAAERALEALAFDRAAALYAEALSVGQLSADERRRVLVARGHALACAGRGQAAAQTFAEAIAGSSTAEVLELQRRIAEQLLNAGYYAEGVTACNAFVEGLGIQVPRTSARVFLGLLLADAWLWLRGMRSRIREREQLSPHEVSRVDAYWAMAKGLGTYDPIRAQLFHSRGLLTALKAGEPYRLSRAIALSALTSVVMGPSGRARADARLAQARRLAERAENPHALAFVAWMQGMLDYMGHCRWRLGADHLRAAEPSLRAQCDDVAWELELCINSRILCQFWLGEWRAVVAAAPERCKEAEARGNRYSLVFARAEWASFAAALSGHYDEGRREIDEVINPLGKGTSPVEAVIHLLAHLRVDLLEGATSRALSRLDGYRPGLAEWLTIRSGALRHIYETSTINVLLAAACHEQGRTAQQLYARAERCANRLVRKGVECTVPTAALAHAAIRAVRQDTGGAVRLLEAAEQGFEAEGMLAHLAAARLRRGQLLGGEAGRALAAQGEQFFAGEGVRDLHGALRLLAAGFPADHERA